MAEMDSNWLLSAAFIAIAVFIAWNLTCRRFETTSATHHDIPLEKDPYSASAIEPLPDFDYKTTPPIQFRPFKSKFHLTMGLESLPLSNLIEIDSTLPSRLQLRQKLLSTHPNSTTQCNPIATPAVNELYTYLTSIYLPTRFPKIYTTSPTHLHNTASPSTQISLSPSSSPLQSLANLGRTLDTDLLILLPSPTTGKYHLQAFITCFPSGFSTAAKLGLPLAEIHKPVPGYAAKLEKSMDRFFGRVECGRAWKRGNWTVTTDDVLFAEKGTHFHEKGGSAEGEGAGEGQEQGEKGGWDAKIEAQRAAVDVDACRLRVERQTLHRLPETGALVFAFKTYQYTLAEVKADGSGPELCAAIDGLGEGSVPGMAFYKRGVIWGDKVKEYMQS